MQHKRIRYEFRLAHWMGIRPWEIPLLTLDQFERACAAVDEAARATRAG